MRDLLTLFWWWPGCSAVRTSPSGAYWLLRLRMTHADGRRIRHFDLPVQLKVHLENWLANSRTHSLKSVRLASVRHSEMIALSGHCSTDLRTACAWKCLPNFQMKNALADLIFKARISMAPWSNTVADLTASFPGYHYDLNRKLFESSNAVARKVQRIRINMID